MHKNALIFLMLILVGCSPESESNVESSKQTQINHNIVPTDNADWALKNADIIFSSTKIDSKGNHIEEMGNFTEYSAFFNKKGQFKLEIDLASVNTNIIIRDQRIRDWLFETETFTTASITSNLDAEQINQLKLNESIQITQPITLDLHGIQSNLDADLIITRIEPSILSVKTNQPVILSVANFGMKNGLQKMTEVMNLSEILPDIPITFKGEFFRPL